METSATQLPAGEGQMSPRRAVHTSQHGRKEGDMLAGYPVSESRRVCGDSADKLPVIPISNLGIIVIAARDVLRDGGRGVGNEFNVQ